MFIKSIFKCRNIELVIRRAIVQVESV